MQNYDMVFGLPRKKKHRHKLFFQPQNELIFPLAGLRDAAGRAAENPPLNICEFVSYCTSNVKKIKK
jgi:hypothetical protein